MKTTKGFLLRCFWVLCASCSLPDVELDNPRDPESPNFTPFAPSLMAVSTPEQEGVYLHWGVSTYVKTVQIERKTGVGGDFEVVARVPAFPSSYTDIHARAETTSVYRVGALAGSGRIIYSTTRSVYFYFPAPANVGPVPLSDGAVRIVWDDRTTGEVGFNVERSVNGGPFAAYKTLSSNTTSVDDSTVVAGNIYEYRVQAFSAANVTKYGISRIGFLGANTSLLWFHPSGAQPRIITTSPHASRYAGYCAGGRLEILRVHSGTVLSQMYAPSGGLLAIDRSNAYLALSVSGTTTVLKILGGSERVVLQGVPSNGLLFSPGGDLLAIAFSSGIVLVNPADGIVFRTLTLDTVRAVAFSEDGTTIAGASGDEVRIWRTYDGGQVSGFQLPENSSPSIGYTPDGNLLIGGGADSVIWVRRVSDGSEVFHWTAGSPVISISVHPQGNQVASVGSVDGQVRLWNYQSGILVDALAVHSQKGIGVMFAIDGHAILSISEDQSVRLTSLGNHWWTVH